MNLENLLVVLDAVINTEEGESRTLMTAEGPADVMMMEGNGARIIWGNLPSSSRCFVQVSFGRRERDRNSNWVRLTSNPEGDGIEVHSNMHSMVPDALHALITTMQHKKREDPDMVIMEIVEIAIDQIEPVKAAPIQKVA